MTTLPSSHRRSVHQLLIHSEKCARDSIDQLRGSLLPNLEELRQLSRSVRRHSSYPTAQTLLGALNRLLQAEQEQRKLIDSLLQQLQEVREHARQQQRQRSGLALRTSRS